MKTQVMFMVVVSVVLLPHRGLLSGPGIDHRSFSELSSEKQLAIRELVRPPSPYGHYGCYHTQSEGGQRSVDNSNGANRKKCYNFKNVQRFKDMNLL